MKKIILVLSLFLLMGCSLKEEKRVYKDYQSYSSINSFVSEYKKNEEFKDREVILDGNIKYGTYNYVVLNYSDDININYHVITLKLDQELYWYSDKNVSEYKFKKDTQTITFNSKVESDLEKQQYLNCSNSIVIKNAPIFNKDTNFACIVSSKKKLNK